MEGARVVACWAIFHFFKEDGERPLPYPVYGHLVSDPCMLPCLCLMLAKLRLYQ